MPGSYISSRQDSFLYIFIILVLIILAVATTVYFIFFKAMSKKRTKEWIEKNKNRDTKYKDVKACAHETRLNKAETLRLWHICKRYKARNILFMYREPEELNTMFQMEYNRMISDSYVNHEKISIFFDLRYKLEKAYEEKLTISSTRSLRENQELLVYDNAKKTWRVKLVKSTKDGFYVSLSKEFLENPDKPKPLSKIRITFTLPTGMAYNCLARAARYEKQPNGQEYMLITHSTTLNMYQRRGAKRMQLENLNCAFSAVKVSEKDGKKAAYQIKENRNKGKLLDISSSGCRIWCGLPIVKGQYIQVYYQLPGDTAESEAQGLIVSTKKASDQKTFVLHIKFTDIGIEEKNAIYAKIYSYS